MKTIISGIAAITAGLGVYLLLLEYNALSSGYFARTFLWGVGCVLIAGIIATLIKDKWVSLIVQMIMIVTGFWLGYQVLACRRDLFTLFFYLFGYAATVWILTTVVFLALKMHRKIYFICFGAGLGLYVILWLADFTFSNFHDSSIPSTFIWTILGILFLTYGSLLNFRTSPSSHK